MYRLLLTTLLAVVLRLLTLAETAAHPPIPIEWAGSAFAAQFDSAAGADTAACVRGRFQLDYFDFTAKALRAATGVRVLQKYGKTLLPDRSDPLPPAYPISACGISLAVCLEAARGQALAWQGFLPSQLNHPPYYATAPPVLR